MRNARRALPWLRLVVATTSLASVASCGATRRGDDHGEMVAGAGSGPPTSGGASSGGAASSGGTGMVGVSAAAGSAPSDAGAGAATSEGGTPAGGAGGADACDAPAVPGCFTCCAPLVCPANSADCDANRGDCETAFGAADACTPTLASVALPSFGTPTVNADGSYFIAGYFLEPTDFDPGAAEDIRTPVLDDVFVSKFSASGEYLWTYTFGKRVYDFNVASGADGSAVVAGSFVRATDPDPDSGAVYTDAFVARLGADGEATWQHVFDGMSQYASGAARVATDGDGNAILSAIFGGDVDFGLGGDTDVRHFGEVGQGYLFELDAAGSIVWSRALGDDKCYVFAQQLTVSREVIALRPSVGIDCVIDGKPLATSKRGYSSLVTFTRRGVLRDVWLLGVQSLSGLLAYDDGSVVASGMFEDELRLGEPGSVIASEETHGSNFVLRFSKDSRLEWVKVVPYSGRLGSSIASTPDDGVLGALVLAGSGTSERYLVAWHADGTAAWTRGLGCSVSPLIASNGDWFMLKTDTIEAEICDLEPGPGSAPAGAAPYLVRYHF